MVDETVIRFVGFFACCEGFNGINGLNFAPSPFLGSRKK